MLASSITSAKGVANYFVHFEVTAVYIVVLARLSARQSKKAGVATKSILIVFNGASAQLNVLLSDYD